MGGEPELFASWTLANSSVLDGIYRIAYGDPDSLGNVAEYTLGLGYAAFAVPEIIVGLDAGASPIGVATGFDSGDGLVLGNLTAKTFVPLRSPRLK